MAGITLHPPMTDPTTPIPTCFGVYTTVIVFTMVHNPSEIATAHSTVVFSRRHAATRAEVQTWHSQTGRRCFCIWQSSTMTTMSTPPTWTRSPLNSSFRGHDDDGDELRAGKKLLDRRGAGVRHT